LIRELTKLIRKAEAEPDSIDAWRNLALVLLRKEDVKISLASDKTMKRIMEEFQERRKKWKDKQTDNSNLLAGSPMYYYCMYCGAHVVTLPESFWLTEVKRVCPECRKHREIIDEFIQEGN